MNIKILSLVASFTALFLVSESSASINPVILSSSESSVQIISSRVVRAIAGGSYVTEMAELSFGYANPRSAHVHIAVYDANGTLLGRRSIRLTAAG
jgi:hypothetical protein